MVEILAAMLLASSGSSQLAVDLMLTNQPGKVFMSWEQSNHITVPSVRTARRGEPVTTLLTFSDCTASRSGNCDVKMDIWVYDPTGRVYGETKGTEVWLDRPAPPGVTQLAVGYMMIRIEPHDPPGRYRVAVAVADHVSGVMLRRETSFDVPPAKATASPGGPRTGPSPTRLVSGKTIAKTISASRLH